MSEIDRLTRDRDKFRNAYAAEVKASAESKNRCNDLIEWTEQQRQAAISSHAGQLRNTIAFKTDVDALVKALEDLQSAETTYRMVYDLDGYHHQNTLEARSKLRTAGYHAREVLSAVGGSGKP